MAHRLALRMGNDTRRIALDRPLPSPASSHRTMQAVAEALDRDG